MIKVKNTSFTLFRWQEFIWKPGETLVFNPEGFNIWEENMARQLIADYGNLVDVTSGDEPVKPKRTKEELKAFKIANLAKARAARKAKSEQSN